MHASVCTHIPEMIEITVFPQCVSEQVDFSMPENLEVNPRKYKEITLVLNKVT